MLVKYTPENGDAKEWEFDPERVRQSEAEQIEKRSGLAYGEWARAVGNGNSKACRVLLWHLMRRDHPSYRYEDVPDFYVSELVIDLAVSELQRIRERIADSDIDPDRKQEALDGIDLELAKRLGKDELDPSDLGKAPSDSAG
jgi:hypothetical protein